MHEPLSEVIRIRMTRPMLYAWIDTYDPITTLPVWKLETNHPLLLTAWLHDQEQAAPRSQRVNRIPGLRPASRKISELCGDVGMSGL